MEQVAQQHGNRRIRSFDQGLDMIGERGSAGWKDKTKLAQKATGGVDPHSPSRHPCRADPVQGCQLLLAFALNRHGADVAVAPGFEHPFHVGAVGF